MGCCDREQQGVLLHLPLSRTLCAASAVNAQLRLVAKPTQLTGPRVCTALLVNMPCWSSESCGPLFDGLLKLHEHSHVCVAATGQAESMVAPECTPSPPSSSRSGLSAQLDGCDCVPLAPLLQAELPQWGVSSTASASMGETTTVRLTNACITGVDEHTQDVTAQFWVTRGGRWVSEWTGTQRLSR